MPAIGDPSRTPPSAGNWVAGRYELVGPLGQGGMGAVFRAVDHTTGRQVALKRLQVAGDQNGDDVLRFRQEFHVLAQLRHPRIIEVYDYGLDGPTPYYTMELLDGQDLRDRAPAPVREACRTLRDVAAALAFLHARRLLHRDIASRNVRCTGSGRAKLIDFGALATMGLAKQVVGTPPYIAPECLRGLPLDQRSDLLGLGALAYWLLTGTHAYPARSVQGLLRAWQTQPPAPSALIEGVPPALDELVLSLLNVDPLARPSSAAEVIERLGSIADLDADGELEVAHAYLESASLIGRKREMEKLRRRIRLAVEGERGRAVVMAAPSGMGKTRLLREVGLEAQLAGAATLTGLASPTSRAPFELARQLVRDLLKTLPKTATTALRPRAASLGRALPEIAEAFPSVRSPAGASDLREQQARIQSDFVACFVEVSAATPLVILVDDLQYADLASLSLLTALAHSTRRHRLLLVCTLRGDLAPRADAAVKQFCEASSLMRLRGLEADQIYELVASLFGETRHATRLASWMNARAGGSPLLCLELARHLVNRGVLRYVDGIWVLPEDLDIADVPREISEAMDAKLTELSADTRALGEVLSLHGGDLPLTRCVRLAEAADEERVFSAIDELVMGEILVGSAAAYQFRHDGIREAFSRRLSPERRRSLHLRVAEMLAREADEEREVEIGWHFLHGGNSARAAPLLAGGGQRLYDAHAFADAVEPLEQALALYSDQHRPAAEQLKLGFDLVSAGYMCDRSLLLRHADETLARAARQAGVNHARVMRSLIGGRAAMMLAVAFAGVRHAATNQPNETLPPTQALRIYVMVLVYSIAAAVAGNDVNKIHELLSLLEPIASLKDTVAHAAYLFSRMLCDFMAGHHQDIRQQADEIFRLVGKSPRLDDFDRKLMEGGALSVAALVPAADGDRRCLDDVARLERLELRVFDVAALQTRIYYHLCRGEVEAGRAYQAELEKVSLQVGSTWQMRSWRVSTEAIAHGHLRDVIGLKRSVAELAALVEREGFRGYQPNLHLARGEYYRERGQLAESKAELEKSLEAIESEETVYTEITHAAYCDTLVALGSFAEAQEVAQQTIRLSRKRNRIHAELRCGRALALCEAASGQHKASLRRLDRLLQQAERIGNPATCGSLHEARARVSLADGDVGGYQRHLKLAERWFRSTGNPVLIARYEWLAKLPEGDPPRGKATAPAQRSSASTIREDAFGSLRLMLTRCASLPERVQQVEQLLREATGATGVVVFLVRPSGDLELPSGGANGDAWRSAQEAIAELSAEPETTPSIAETVDSSDSTWQSHLLVSARGKAVAVAALCRPACTLERDLACLFAETLSDGPPGEPTTVVG